jgi:hypothetical protein
MSMSARLFLERHGLRQTYRSPLPTVSPNDSPIHSVPVLQPPLPVPHALFEDLPLSGGALTEEPWPHAENCDT